LTLTFGLLVVADFAEPLKLTFLLVDFGFATLPPALRDMAYFLGLFVP
jgi:hypothetical protein